MSQLQNLQLRALIARNPGLGHAARQHLRGDVRIPCLRSSSQTNQVRGADSTERENQASRAGHPIRQVRRGRDPRHPFVLDVSQWASDFLTNSRQSLNPPAAMDHDAISKFFTDQDRRMGMPDETEAEFLARVVDRSNRLSEDVLSSDGATEPGSDHRAKTPRNATSNTSRHSMRVAHAPAASASLSDARSEANDQAVCMSTLEDLTHGGKRKSSDQPSGGSGPPGKRRRQEDSTDLTAPYRGIGASPHSSAQTSTDGAYHTVDQGLRPRKDGAPPECAGGGKADGSSISVDGNTASRTGCSPAIRQFTSGPRAAVGRSVSPASAPRAPGLSRDGSPSSPHALPAQVRTYTQAASHVSAGADDEPSAHTSIGTTSRADQDEASPSSPSAGATQSERVNGQAARPHGNAPTQNESPGCSAAVAGPDSHSVTTPTRPLPPSDPPAPNAKPPGRRDASSQGGPPAKAKKLPKKVQLQMTPAEYAVYIAQVGSVNARKGKKNTTFFKGIRIFYIGLDVDKVIERTWIKMQRLVQFGATLIPTYDPFQIDVIMTQPKLTEEDFCAKLGIASLEEVPAHIPILATSWMTSGEDKGRLDLWEHHPSYKSHVVKQPDAPEKGKTRTIPPNPPKASTTKPSTKDAAQAKPAPRSTPKVQAQQAIDSNESDFEEEGRGQTSPANPRCAGGSSAVTRGTPAAQTGDGGPGAMGAGVDTGSSGAGAADPLAEFYAAARAEHEEALEGYMEEVPRSRFICDNPEPYHAPWGKPPNQDIIDIFSQLAEIYRIRRAQDDEWRELTYRRVVRALEKYPKRIETYDELKNIDGAGEKTRDKMMEIIKTGRLRRLQFEMTAELSVMKLFQGIHDVGHITALKWHSAGCRTLDDLRQRKNGIKLTDNQELGLKYYDDLNSRIPRQEAAEIFEKIKDIAYGIDKKLELQLVGSYRRGKADVGDIDILITRPTDDRRTHRGLVQRLVNLCQMHGVIVDHLDIPYNWWAQDLSYHGLCQLHEGSPVRRLDFLATPYASRGAALLYFTGDDIFNRSMRGKAKSMGGLLNQRGLYDKVVRSPENPAVILNEGILVASETEEEIFKKLGVPWQEPHERVRG
ncbi:hypothetical protein PsYK624_149000 [Phanerochaete sordida]|uniref:DNA-directed DNA polymerase n=1 Tax=Phanerochaete sordida TaxID=48140 RepID=A0A9P3LKS9_9APHY|nr:hypothetical protein PsYK624_149000 [Phanerochaete sordida]